MTVFVHPNGYYGYAFMFERKRYSHTFKGLSKDDVATKEMEHKLALKKKLSYIAMDEVIVSFDAVVNSFNRLTNFESVEVYAPVDVY